MDIMVHLVEVKVPGNIVNYIEEETDYNKLLETFKEKCKWTVHLFGLDLFRTISELERKYKDELSKIPGSEQTKVIMDYLKYVKKYWLEKNREASFFMWTEDDYASFRDSYNNFVKYFSSYKSFPEFLNNEKTPTVTGKAVINKFDKLLNDFFTEDMPKYGTYVY